MMQWQPLPYGEWLPDQPAMAGAVRTAKNVVPLAQGYATVRQLVSLASPLDGACLAALSCKDSTGIAATFAATAGKLYKQSANTWDDVSNAGGYTAAGWEFAKYGERIIAVPSRETIQYYDIGTSTDFADLPGLPPAASHVAVVRDFVVLGNLLEGATDRTAKIAWSGFNSSEVWGSDLATQTDSQELFGNGGQIMRIVGGSYGVIFQETAIQVMTYVGAPAVFRIDEVEPESGTPASRSVCPLGNLIFYWGHDGFYVFNGQSSAPIGAEKVDRFMAGDLDVSQIEKFVGCADRKNSLIFWSYPSKSMGRQMVIIFNWRVKKWALIDQQVEMILQYFASGYNLDTLDSILTDIDTDSFDMDSPQYQGGALQVAVFDMSHGLATFSGDAMQAEIETADLFDTNGRALFIEKARMMTESTDMQQLQWAGRDRQSDNFDFGVTTYTENDYGEVSLRKTARYHRIKHFVAANTGHITGVEVRMRLASNRNRHVG